jgi:hypothetical protein
MQETGDATNAVDAVFGARADAIIVVAAGRGGVAVDGFWRRDGVDFAHRDAIAVVGAAALAHAELAIVVLPASRRATVVDAARAVLAAAVHAGLDAAAIDDLATAGGVTTRGVESEHGREQRAQKPE